MATTTRAAILRRAMVQVPFAAFATADGSAALTSTSGSTSSVVDTLNVMPIPAASELMQDWWVYRPAAGDAGDQRRFVAEYDAVNLGWKTAPPVYANAPTTERYLVTKEDPYAWNRAVNEALRLECFFVRRDTFTPTSNTKRNYVVTAAPISISDFLRATQIHDIQSHPTNDASGEERWVTIAPRLQWDPVTDDNAITLEFSRALDTAREYRLVSTHAFPVLTDETTTSTVDEEWAAFATVLVMARWYGDPQNPNDRWARAGRDALRFVRDRRRAELQKYGFREVGRHTQQGGGARVRGRAGR